MHKPSFENYSRLDSTRAVVPFSPSLRFVQFECALRPVHTIAPDQTVSSVRNEQIWPVVSSAGEVLGGARGETSQPLARFRVEGLSPPKEITLELKVKVCTIKSESPSPVVHSCTDLE